MSNLPMVLCRVYNIVSAIWRIQMNNRFISPGPVRLAGFLNCKNRTHTWSSCILCGMMCTLLYNSLLANIVSCKMDCLIYPLNIDSINSFSHVDAYVQSGPVIPMPVPSSFNDITTDRNLQNFVGWVWYDRTFFVAHEWTLKRIVLRVDSAHYNAIVVSIHHS